MSYTGTTVVRVMAWGRLMGAVSAGGSRGSYAFQYSPEWIRSGIQPSPILMPLRRRPYVFPSLPRETFHGLPPMLADSLPDSFGNTLIEAWMAEQGIDRSAITTLDRLVYLGSRGMGALEFEPDLSPDAPAPSALDMEELVDTARAAVQGTLGDDASSRNALQQIISVGTSAGGARAKAIVNYDPAIGRITSGDRPADDGHEAWLLKFDGLGDDRQLGRSQQYGRIEYAYSLMAREAGIDMAPTRLLEENGRAHFMTRRFDRDGRRKLHMQSLTGLAAVDFRATRTNSYAQVIATAQKLGLDTGAMTQIWRRMAFNIAASNNDDHAKNVSFLMDEDGGWRLAPAYDVTFAYNPRGEWTDRHQMSVNGRFDGIGNADLMAVADQFAVGHARDALHDISDALDSWPRFAKQAGLSGELADALAADFHREVLEK
ncbi:type II toxin-antitoxin system HipA family toxin [uncultured Bifidobacterium sp.]|uniref:type II toxin-antitoxin system HipA family toxin n=1 Tax=uncultured Bifidobacterium sp. TaxID=165187 RepID=UPI00260A46D2|nr:type II toxin-antitoxin system HipA family toxin [uncultured Bifidobacterium sp.]